MSLAQDDISWLRNCAILTCNLILLFSFCLLNQSSTNTSHVYKPLVNRRAVFKLSILWQLQRSEVNSQTLPYLLVVSLKILSLRFLPSLPSSSLSAKSYLLDYLSSPPSLICSSPCYIILSLLPDIEGTISGFPTISRIYKILPLFYPKLFQSYMAPTGPN